MQRNQDGQHHPDPQRHIVPEVQQALPDIVHRRCHGQRATDGQAGRVGIMEEFA
jgi:hypothetical protein